VPPSQRRDVPPAPEETRDFIIETAMRLFAERGYDGVSIRDITNALELTPGAIYYHFAGKKELYERVVEASFEQVMLLLTTPAERSGSPRQRLHAAIRRLADFISDAPVAMQMVDRLIFEGDAPMTARINGVVGRAHGAIASIIREIDPAAPPAVAEHVLAAVYGAQKLRPIRASLTTATGLETTAGLADSLTDFTMAALGAPRRRAKR
jgi:AcrR family transcriptional regulator